MQVLPVSEIIVVDPNSGSLYLNGRVATQEEETELRAGARALQNNFALNFVRDQVAREYVKMGIYNGLNTDMIMFAKAALHYQQEENKVLATLINR